MVPVPTYGKTMVPIFASGTRRSMGKLASQRVASARLWFQNRHNYGTSHNHTMAALLWRVRANRGEAAAGRAFRRLSLSAKVSRRVVREGEASSRQPPLRCGRDRGAPHARCCRRRVELVSGCDGVPAGSRRSVGATARLRAFPRLGSRPTPVGLSTGVLQRRQAGIVGGSGESPTVPTHPGDAGHRQPSSFRMPSAAFSSGRAGRHGSGVGVMSPGVATMSARASVPISPSIC